MHCSTRSNSKHDHLHQEMLKVQRMIHYEL